MRWQYAGGSFELTDRPLLLGILNVTPDSFSDGGKYFEAQAAIEQGLKLFSEGAAIVDVGGESTRPGATELGVGGELDRVLPVIEGILREKPGAVLSIDTYKSETARQAVAAGAAIVNDVGGSRWDPDMLEAVLCSKAGYIGMHSREKPATMQKNPRYENVVGEVFESLSGLKEKFLRMGIEEDRLALDVGIGFAKNITHNLELLRARERWPELRRPMVWGVSRKSFISRLLEVEEREAGGMAVHAWLRAGGAPQIWRVHEICGMKQFLEMWDLLE